jgi:hypothetical protein
VFKIFIYQSLKGFLRNTRFDLGLILKILIIISVLDICILIYLFGANFKEILHKLLPLEDPVKYFYDCLFYLMPVFCLLLFFLQKSNCTYIRSYLHLPISSTTSLRALYIRKAQISNTLTYFEGTKCRKYLEKI